MTKLDFRHVQKVFTVRDENSRKKTKKHFTALQDFTLEVPEGQFLTVVGPSGCGKSTLLDLLAGLSQPSAGEILLDGKPIEKPGLDRAVVFQQYALLPWRTTQANIEFGLAAKGIPRRDRAEIAEHYIELVGLSGFAGRYPHELSGGMKQRVAIARALAVDPEVLLMDEPFAALDAQTRETLQDELLRIWQATKKTIVFITHGIEEAIYLGQRVAVMTPRPGKLQTVLDINLDPSGDEDIRSHPDFGRLRHEVWTHLHSHDVSGNQSQDGASNKEKVYA